MDRLGAEVDLQPGRTLTREGAEGYEVFMVRAGVAVATRGARRVGAIRAGSVAGELALLDGTVRTATVVAAAPMRVVVFTATEFEELLAVAPCIEDGVRRIAAERRTKLSRPSSRSRSQSDGEIPPLLGLGTISQLASHALDDGTELMMAERPDHDAAGMVAARLRPFPQQRCEVTSVARHEDPILLGGELQHLRIVERAEGSVGREAQHVVTSLLEDRTDPFW